MLVFVSVDFVVAQITRNAKCFNKVTVVYHSYHIIMSFHIILHFVMLCYVMLCYVISCHALPGHVILCYYMILYHIYYVM